MTLPALTASTAAPSTAPALPHPARRPAKWGLGLTLAAALALCGCATGAGSDWTTAWVSSYGNWPAGRAAGSYVFDRLPSQQMAQQLAQQQTVVPIPPLLDARGRVQREQDSASLSPAERSAQAALSRRGFFPAPVGSAPALLVQVSQNIVRDVQPSPVQVGWALSYGTGGRHRHRGGLGLSMAIAASGGHDPYGPYDRYDRYGPDDGWPGWGPDRYLEPYPRPYSQPYRVRYQRELGLVLRDAATSQALFEARVQEPEAHSDAPALIEQLFAAALAPFPQASPQPQRVVVSAQPLPAPALVAPASVLPPPRP